MIERPILFSGEMVRAILCGRKTQTRRVVKPQPAGAWAAPGKTACPHGQPGDVLWVREAFAAWFSGNPWREWPKELRTQRYASNVFYRATHHYPDDDQKWVPSIFMPRWVSRIMLEVTGVRVERVQDISAANAMAEGIRPVANSMTIDCDTLNPVCEFRRLWDTINAKRGYGWDANPWVWVVEFRRLEASQ